MQNYNAICAEDLTYYDVLRYVESGSSQISAVARYLIDYWYPTWDNRTQGVCERILVGMCKHIAGYERLKKNSN
jgi:hypothetical protein